MTEYTARFQQKRWTLPVFDAIQTSSGRRTKGRLIANWRASGQGILEFTL